VSSSFGALQNKTWSTPAEYVEAIDSLPVGPMSARCLVFGSPDLGARASIAPPTRDVEPTDAELEKMAAMVGRRFAAGMLGMSG